MKVQSNRVGKLIRSTAGYDVFIPHSLYPDGPRDLNLDEETILLLSEAATALGELKGITKLLPNPDLFIAFYVRKEALLSSQIEGTECSLDEVLQADEETPEVKPAHEVINYISAMRHGLEGLKSIPLSIRLINEIHANLLDGVRGKDKNPGSFKKKQNWIGPDGCTVHEAYFVPPPPDQMNHLMGDFEKYYHLDKKIPPLIEASILHAHFETIHPYADGNGRVGRLLITFLLCQRQILDEPLLYLSLFFKENKKAYYDHLMDIRLLGKWEEWIKFFLRGIRNTSIEAADTVREILRLQEKHRGLIKKEMSKHRMSITCYEVICKFPIASIPAIVKATGASYPGIKSVIEGFVKIGIVSQVGNKQRNKIYRYGEYLDILRRGT